MSGNFINANTGPPSTTSLGYTICNILQPSTITSNTQNTLSILNDNNSVQMEIGVWLISASIIFTSFQLYSSSLQIVTADGITQPQTAAFVISQGSSGYVNSISLNVSCVYYNNSNSTNTTQFGIAYTCNGNNVSSNNIYVANDNISVYSPGTVTSTKSTMTYTKIA